MCTAQQLFKSSPFDIHDNQKCKLINDLMVKFKACHLIAHQHCNHYYRADVWMI